MDKTIQEILSRPAISASDAAKVYNVSQNQIYAMAKTGEIESVRLRGRVIFPTAPMRKRLGIEAAA
jgi:hypothetical protein